MDRDQLIWELQNGSDRQRRVASHNLAKSKDPSVVQALIDAFGDPDIEVRRTVVWGLGKIGSKEAIEFLDSPDLPAEARRWQERRWRFIIEESQRWRSIVQSRLLPDEQLVDIVGDLEFSVNYVPHIEPHGTYQTEIEGTLVLTTHRIIAIWALAEPQRWKWFHIPAINSLSETPLHPDEPIRAYQAMLMIPGGIGIVVQTRSPHAEHGKRLSLLLTKAFMRFGVQRDDNGALAVIITHEEEEKARQEEEERRRMLD
jgi:hypothetical protein